MRLKPKIRATIRLVGDLFVLREDTILYEDTVLGKYTQEMARLPRIKLKEKTRAMLTVIKEADYIIGLTKYNITFLVTYSSAAVEDARIVIGGREYFTNSSGNAVVRLKAGTYPYTVTHPSYDTVIDSVTVTADATENVAFPVADPIPALVDEYKAYVASQGGTIGVSDAALYAEYEEMVTAGEYQTDHTNTKLTQNVGLWGYKKDGSDLITELYSLCKIAGNYVKIETPAGNNPLWTASYIDLTAPGGYGAIPIALNYAKNSFYIETNAKIQRATADSTIIFTNPVTIQAITRTSNGLRFTITSPATVTYTPSSLVENAFKKYRFIWGRTGDDLVYNIYKDGSAFSNSSVIAWDFSANVNISIRNSASTTNIFQLTYVKTGLV